MAVLDRWTGGEEDVRRIHAFMDRYEGQLDPLEGLIPVLHLIQSEYRYVPERAAELISARWQIPETDIFGVVTFYADFRSEPEGVNRFWVCEGAACYFMGGPEIGAAAQRKLGIGYDETTPDGEWTLLRADFCFGACHLAPLAEVNHKIEGYLTADKVERLLEQPPAGDSGGSAHGMGGH